ncbi:hypothetical protein KC19_4G170500 [Ceratodon purpureus]|uniref:Uncharacterized protein n=1 Tax=Ceratodon purpureus TaxID=3225 RepID=A0A8T0IAF4_CERPU|nr:hypothetical protein KC19_4G170500 [Ceratodon purpureus]
MKHCVRNREGRCPCLSFLSSNSTQISKDISVARFFQHATWKLWVASSERDDPCLYART